ncbi:WGR domain-containing protein [Neorhizobium sp. LjRoot104]|uniref:WGR domain-containing protein n=1 Tax=Neorhizobium sp. LjRoot104 TaxID=3342254 RepID=UPI003F4F8321
MPSPIIFIERIDAHEEDGTGLFAVNPPTLFGEASLLCCWSRIGCRDQQIIHMFAAEVQAVALLLDLLSEKRKKGYRPRTSCGNPGYPAPIAITAQ